jgi:murein L,D-transpeptidase YcbB/YkuD
MRCYCLTLFPALLLAAPVAAAQPELAPAATGVSDVESGVAAFYAARKDAPLWLSDAASINAAQLLVPVLRRSPLDGLAEGPQLAERVEAALDNPGKTSAERRANERLIAASWVRFVQALKRPARGFVYGDKALEPRVPSAEAILLEAASARSLSDHLLAVSRGNPIYGQLRDSLWAQMRHDPDLAQDARLRASLDRARILPSRGRYVVVDAASALLWMFEDGKPVDSMKVVVGKPDTPTPLLAGTINYATFNPYWNIPEDVAQRVVAPLVLKRGVQYLADAEYEVTSGWSDEVIDPATVDWQAVADGTVQIQLRQRPGPNNIMGAVKFSFPNALGIYLHDTPLRHLMAEPQRNFSLGCVRLEDAQRLGRWLLGSEDSPATGEPEQHVRLPRPVPVYITYLTARGESGRLVFAPDVYGFDGPPVALAAAGPTPAGTAQGPVIDAAPTVDASPIADVPRPTAEASVGSRK